jgi:iron complex outermembrane recepter protein
MSISSRAILAGFGFLALTGGFAGAASAEQAATPAPAPKAEPATEEVIVTGTRTAGRSRLDTIAPVDVVSAATLSQSGTTELAQALSGSIPSFNFPRPAITDGTDHIRPATLRGLAPDQTLVLMNSKRRHATALININGSVGRGSTAVDLNSIPTSAISAIEVLRDGASAMYGSDAIAGVINIRLREASEGGNITATYGQYNTQVTTARQQRDENDGRTITIAGWAGLQLGKDGYLTLSGEFRDRDATSRGDRDPRIVNPLVDSPTGSFISSRYGDPNMRDLSVYANAGKPLGGDWEAYGWLGLQQRKGDSAAFPRIRNDADGRNDTAVYASGFLPLIASDIGDVSGGLGFKGPLANWDMDMSLVYGRNELNYGVKNSLNRSYGVFTQNQFDAGGLSYDQWVANIGGVRTWGGDTETPVSVAAGLEYRTEDFTVRAGETQSWARGPVFLSVGQPGCATANVPGNPTSCFAPAGAQGFPGFRPANAGSDNRNAVSAYVDLEANLTPNFQVSAAVRGEDYSDFGSTVTYKGAARWDMFDGFALRGAYSTGFRAPALQQTSFTAASTNFVAGVPVDIRTIRPDDPLAIFLGAKPLEAEESTNMSLGAVFRAGKFEATLDAYRIDVDNRIVLSENLGAAGPNAAYVTAVRNIIQGVDNTVSAVRFFINGVNTESEGIDLVLRYRFEDEAVGKFDFTIAGNKNETKVTKVPRTPTTGAFATLPAAGSSFEGRFSPLFGRFNVLAFEEGTPKEKATFTTVWERGIFGATLRATYYGRVLEPANNPALDIPMAAEGIFDIEGRAKLDKITLSLGADNIGDAYPKMVPVAANTTGALGFSRFSPFGFGGRYVFGKVAYNW